MFTIEKANKLLEICYKEFSSLQDYYILIKEDEEFFMQESYLKDFMSKGYVIGITKELERNKFQSWMNNYLSKEFDIDSNIYMFHQFNEVFAFLHEIGHIYYNDSLNDYNLYYEEYKQKEYFSYSQAYLSYRQIPAENLADNFASIIMKNQLISIWSLMNDITEEEATEEYNFWNN